MHVNWWPWNSGGDVVVNNILPDNGYYPGAGCCGGGFQMPPIFMTMMKYQMIQQFFNMAMNNIFPNRQQQQVPGYMQTRYPGLYLQQGYDGRGGALSEEQADNLKMQRVITGIYKDIQTLSDGTVLAKDSDGNLIKASSMTELFEMAQEAAEAKAARARARAEREDDDDEVRESRRRQRTEEDEEVQDADPADEAEDPPPVNNNPGTRAQFGSLPDGYEWKRHGRLSQAEKDAIRVGMTIDELCQALGVDTSAISNYKDLLKQANPNGIVNDKVADLSKLDVIHKASQAPSQAQYQAPQMINGEQTIFAKVEPDGNGRFVATYEHDGHSLRAVADTEYDALLKLQQEADQFWPGVAVGRIRRNS